MSRQPRTWDEDDVRIRPGRGKSRPRSKDRPTYSDALPARVITVDRGRFTVVTDDGRTLLAIKARELGRKGVVVGDRVALVGDTSSDTDALARIVRLENRSTILRRTADDVDPVERVVVANADQIGIVASLADPAPRYGFIDRTLVAAYDAGLQPLLILTKADLAPARPVIDAYAALDVPAVTIARGEAKQPAPADLDAMVEHLTDHVTVLIGHSGVGKSTLVNALVPGAHRSVGHVNEVTGRGRHTSTSVLALPLPRGQQHQVGQRRKRPQRRQQPRQAVEIQEMALDPDRQRRREDHRYRGRQWWCRLCELSPRKIHSIRWA